MKISEKISYPYPIWGWFENYKTNKASYRLEQNLNDADSFIFKMTVDNQDSVVKQLIAEHKAAYACIATCSSTFYNQFVTEEDPTITISIPRDDVYGTVNVIFMIVATSNIPDYQNPNLDDFYEGSAFLPKGAAIALLYEGDFEAVATSGKTLGDVIKVVENTWSNEIETDVDNPCIRIALPADEYNVFDTWGANYKAVLHSTIVYNALLKAIGNLQSFSKTNPDYEWVKYLDNEIKGMEDILDVEDLADEGQDERGYSIHDAMKIANRILKQPTRRALVEISDIESRN